MARKGYRRCVRCGKNRSVRRYVGTRGRICDTCRKQKTRSTSRDRRLRETYGISEEEYKLILEHQGGVCAGCHQPRNYNLSVDHDHKIEQTHGSRASVRGLLCKRCNKVLRDVRDDILVLLQLADYLAEWPAQYVLGADSATTRAA